MMTAYNLPLKNSDRCAVIDMADAELVAGFVWKLWGNGYVGTQRGQMYIYLHRLIAGAGPTEQVDHEDGNPLDNRKGNLRIATPSQNGANRGALKTTGRTSRYKGVSWDKSRKVWRCYIHVNGKTRYVGQYTQETAAAEAYNSAAQEAWGRFARLNILREEAAAERVSPAP